MIFGRKTGLWMEEAYGFHEKYMVFVFYIDGKILRRYLGGGKLNKCFLILISVLREEIAECLMWRSKICPLHIQGRKS